MAFSKGKISTTLTDILNRVSESQILVFYLGISSVPIVINSPLRRDSKPSFGLYSPDGKKICYKDLATGDSGGLFDLLGHLWNKDFQGVIEKIDKDIPNMHKSIDIKEYISTTIYKGTDNSSELKCRVREWRDYDVDYWESYGISLKWLQYAEVYPISHKIIVKNGSQYTFGADKYAYAYVEHKEGKDTLKIYQPKNTLGYKWANKHDRSVISLWTKVPKKGKIICICSSLKDALCLWSNTGIPCIAIQGEGYNISQTAINNLKERFKTICIMLDNDTAGLQDAAKLAETTGFTNVILPQFEGGKDISDYYHIIQDQHIFNKNMLALFKSTLNLEK